MAQVRLIVDSTICKVFDTSQVGFTRSSDINLSFFWVALFLQLPYDELGVLTFNVIMNRTHFFGGQQKWLNKNVIKIRVILASGWMKRGFPGKLICSLYIWNQGSIVT